MATTNQYLTYRDSFHWDKDAYVAAGCTPTGGCDYTKARDRHFVHVYNVAVKSTAVESVKYPLENRIWFNYPGQASSIFGGSYDKPTAAGRVLDDAPAAAVLGWRSRRRCAAIPAQGVVVSAREQDALIVSQSTGKSYQVRTGDVVEGWRVERITAESVAFTKGGIEAPVPLLPPHAHP